MKTFKVYVRIKKVLTNVYVQAADKKLVHSKIYDRFKTVAISNIVEMPS